MDRHPRGAGALVEYQVHRWEMDRARKRKEEEEAYIWPLITISREFGALGTQLATQLRDRLSWTKWDQELVHELAEHSDAPEALIASLDEHRRDAVVDLIKGFLLQTHITESEYLEQLMQVVHTIAHHGKSVVVGRGAHYILDDDEALRVRLVRPFEQRVEWLMERNEMNHDDASEEVQRVDAERLSFMNHHYGRNIEDPHDFDVLINTGTVSVENAIDIVMTAYRSKFNRLPG